ncbi:cation diffusion facilitator family transporter [Zooshikella sp. RANM57]|uniref:cation diffusion facilitator family transporter n=1 Tax=Zooshikella sp. RANM57 TaxID=3425863 RepID=UPI003D6E15CA
MAIFKSDDKVFWLRFASTASVVTAIILILVKLIAWVVTDSVSILASLIDSSLDAMASIINYGAVSYSLKPADEDHRFGHGKAESLAGLAQSMFIMGSALVLIFHAVGHWRKSMMVDAEWVGVSVSVFAIVLTLVLLCIQHFAVKLTGSVAIKADSLHYRMDVLTNLAVIVALILTAMGFTQADSLFAIGIAIYMVVSAREILVDAINRLMDRELPVYTLSHIETLALAVHGVRGIHQLRTRQSGMIPIIQMHVELDKNLTLEQAHQIADNVEAAIQADYPDADITIHQDPV